MSIEHVTDKQIQDYLDGNISQIDLLLLRHKEKFFSYLKTLPIL